MRYINVVEAKLYISKKLLYALLLLIFKIVESLQCVLKILFPFHLEWKISANVNIKKFTNLDKLTNIYFANQRM